MTEHEIDFEIERGDETVKVLVVCHLEGMTVRPSLYYPGEEPELVIDSAVGEEHGVPYDLTVEEVEILDEIVREREIRLKEREW